MAQDLGGPDAGQVAQGFAGRATKDLGGAADLGDVDMPAAAKEELKQLTPASYIGNAVAQAKRI